MAKGSIWIFSVVAIFLVFLSVGRSTIPALGGSITLKFPFSFTVNSSLELDKLKIIQ